VSSTTPVFGTREWAEKTANVQEGCQHDCRYCYAKEMAVRFGRKRPDDWHNEVPRPDLIAKVLRGRPCRVMFPSTHDIIPANLPVCVAAMDAMLDHGHSLLVVSKPHVDCIEAICGRYLDERTRILFRFTIGSASDEVLSFWEPGAPSFMERLDSLCLAAERGFQTSVSCEPMLDDNVEEAVAQVLPFVTDAVWIGKANRLRARLLINGAGPEVVHAGEALVAMQNDARIRDLYLKYRDNPKIKWKESIKKVIGIEVPKQAGLDM
jgi:DNA repair photolyase